MPFPDSLNIDDADLSLGDSVNLLLASIACEEFALANLINAEADKIQHILGTPDGQSGRTPPATLNQILEVNRSADQTLRDIIKKEILLQLKLEKVLEVPLDEAAAADSNSASESAADAASSSAFVSAWAAGTDFGTGCAQYTTFDVGERCKIVNLNQAGRKIPVGFVRIVRRESDLVVTVSADEPYFIDQVYLYVGLVPPETDVPEDFTYHSVVADPDDFFTSHTFVVSESPEQTYYISAFARLIP